MDTQKTKGTIYVIPGDGCAYWKDEGELRCAPILNNKKVDTDAWTIVEEYPETEKSQLREVMESLGFDKNRIEEEFKTIGWY